MRVTNDVKPFHELGQRFATELRPGNINVCGTIDRAYINGALLKLMLGDAADSRPAGTFLSPVVQPLACGSKTRRCRAPRRPSP